MAATNAYYNEWDPQAAAWLRELIRLGLIAPGDVDERSITEVSPDDLKGYTQHHFFAGIGGWSYAARLSGWPDDRPLWTGSPPCQPFSTAGKQLGVSDERHLAPAWLSLVAAVRPPFVAGEQVATAINKDNWLDDLLDGLEAEGYATGAIVLPACGVGAPHIRQRLWFVGRLADADSEGSQGQSGMPKRADQLPSRPGGLDGSTHAPKAGWDDSDWFYCRDGSWRPVESGAFPLADGVPNRVVRLRGYGNAIVPQVAAEVLTALMSNAAAARSA